jgi:predicted nucleic acid-binding protein
MAALLIDSSVLIAAERGELDLDAFLQESHGEAVAIAAITASELLHGVHRATKLAQRQRREAFVEQILATLPVIPFDLLIARIHASLGARLAAKGASIRAHDLLIAATALALDFHVATHDSRSFPKVPGLKVVVV